MSYIDFIDSDPQFCEDCGRGYFGPTHHCATQDNDSDEPEQEWLYCGTCERIIVSEVVTNNRSGYGLE